MAVIALLRHGHSTANADGVLAGWSPGVALTQTGRAQAQAIAPTLRGLAPVLVVTSPLQRCRETTELACGTLAVPVRVEEDLGECRYGAWTGRSLAELVREAEWREVQDHPETARFPASERHEGESLAQMAARLDEVIARIDTAVEAEHGPDAVWVAVSHGDPIKSVLAQAAGVGVAGLQRFHVDPGSLSVVRRHVTATGTRSMVLLTNHRGGSLDQIVRATAAARGDAPGEASVGGGAGGE